jgi:hypothetical protein
MNLDSNSIIIIALIIINIVLALMIYFLYKKFNRILGGKGNAKTLEEAVIKFQNDVKNLEEFKGDTTKYLTDVEKRLRASLRGLHTVRFNPFKGTGSGGNQSFATAIVNEDGDGVIISSLYSREHVSIFSKPVKKHLSEFDLTEEEREALTKAKEKLK